MHSGVAVEQILRWRVAQAEASAPPAPRATHLLELARPWWERWPDRFRSRVERLAQMPLVYGFAMVTPDRDRRGHPVPVLLAHAEDRETYAHVLYFQVRDHDLRMRLELDFGADTTTRRAVRTRPTRRPSSTTAPNGRSWSDTRCSRRTGSTASR
jgi:hypothetical protein